MYVRKRFEVIRNLEKEFGVQGKTPTLVSIKCLVDRLGVNNPFGKKEDFDTKIKENYRGDERLSYLGVNLKKGSVADVVRQTQTVLDGCKFNECFMHGTTATELEEIFADNLRLDHSYAARNVKHDFGQGVYCFKGQLKWALYFAIDCCWQGSLPDDPNSPEPHSDGNPAIVVCLEPFHIEDDQIFQVGSKKPFTDEELKKRLPRSFSSFAEKRDSWEKVSDEEQNWKEFVKLARTYGTRPKDCVYYVGWLHDCYRTTATDKCAEPVIDKDRWEQYCFSMEDFLGENFLFIEFNVNWNEWLDHDVDVSIQKAS
ncbi:expressed unknown protein [Seminavis robusta]|uniref:Uncharacterized protein n=1 Tax=Seminavis robusta TaxID=568900 RepID=A0A9N8EUB4_9STRA|nr:expressed unknown protein [Seminavis robusta]|eukprot:Sro1596_g284740.1 n/a (313) ;mRNA; r:2124-3062